MPAWVTPLNVALRGIMEAGLVAALGYWGYTLGATSTTRVLFAIGVPIVGFGIWGLVDFRWAGKLAEGLRLTEELVLTGLGAVALHAAGAVVLAWVLAALSILHHVLVYATGQRLLRKQT